MTTHTLSSSSIVIGPRPSNDADRVAALRKYSILDAEQGEIFDCSTRMARRLCGTELSVISLVDENRVFSLSVAGFEGLQGISEPRDDTWCTYTILSNDKPFIILDANQDQKYCSLPLVSLFKLRFYLGVPLVTREGYPIGTLCVLDTTPRETVSEDLIEGIKSLSKVVVSAIERRATTIKYKLSQEMGQFDMNIIQNDTEKLFTAVNFFKDGFVAWDEKDEIVLVNESFSKITGYSDSEANFLQGIDFLISSDSDSTELEKLKRGFGFRKLTQVEMICKRNGGENFYAIISIRPVFNHLGQFINFFGTISDQSDRKRMQLELELERNNSLS